MNHPVLRRIGAATLLALSLSATAHAANLSIVTPAAPITVGSSFSIDLRVSDLDADQALSVFDLQLAFDPSLLQFNSYRLRDLLGSLAQQEAMDLSSGLNAPGQLQLGELSLLEDLSGQPKAFVLLTLNFSAIQAGSSSLSFSKASFGDTWGSALPVSLNDGSLSVSAVPEPASAALLLAGLGLLGLSVQSRRKTR